MNGTQPAGYFEYVVPPLEGLWRGEDGYFDGRNIADKNKLVWTSMIRQPDFVTAEVFEATDRYCQKETQNGSVKSAAYKVY